MTALSLMAILEFVNVLMTLCTMLLRLTLMVIILEVSVLLNLNALSAKSGTLRNLSACSSKNALTKKPGLQNIGLVSELLQLNALMAHMIFMETVWNIVTSSIWNKIGIKNRFAHAQATNTGNGMRQLLLLLTEDFKEKTVLVMTLLLKLHGRSQRVVIKILILMES